MPETPDLRDEIEYLRTLVERLLDELRKKREALVPLVPPPAPIILPSPPPAPAAPWYTPWTPPYGNGHVWMTAETTTTTTLT